MAWEKECKSIHYKNPVLCLVSLWMCPCRFFLIRSIVIFICKPQTSVEASETLLYKHLYYRLLRPVKKEGSLENIASSGHLLYINSCIIWKKKPVVFLVIVGCYQHNEERVKLPNPLFLLINMVRYLCKNLGFGCTQLLRVWNNVVIWKKSQCRFNSSVFVRAECSLYSGNNSLTNRETSCSFSTQWKNV